MCTRCGCRHLHPGANGSAGAVAAARPLPQQLVQTPAGALAHRAASPARPPIHTGWAVGWRAERRGPWAAGVRQRCCRWDGKAEQRAAAQTAARCGRGSERAGRASQAAPSVKAAIVRPRATRGIRCTRAQAQPAPRPCPYTRLCMDHQNSPWYDQGQYRTKELLDCLQARCRAVSFVYPACGVAYPSPGLRKPSSPRGLSCARADLCVARCDAWRQHLAAGHHRRLRPRLQLQRRGPRGRAPSALCSSPAWLRSPSSAVPASSRVSAAASPRCQPPTHLAVASGTRARQDGGLRLRRAA